MSHSPSLANQLRNLGFDFNPLLMRRLDPEVRAMLEEATGKLTEAVNDFASQFAKLAADKTPAVRQRAPVSAPEVKDSCHPAGSLRTNGDVITTPGGYKIEMIGQYEWKITGPDGKYTRVHGDPHVDEGDRDGASDWDFKRNSTFVLADGTRINVKTVPGGAPGMTVTGQLEVISGNDRVVASDIDKGKGQIGAVTHDGFQHVNSFKGDVFVMGREADDWSYQGREVIGSERGGESFKLGDNLQPSSTRNATYEDGMRWAMSLLNNVLNQWQSNWRPNNYGSNPYSNNERSAWERGNSKGYDRQRHVENLSQAFRALGAMFTVLGVVSRLNEQISAARYNRPQQV